MLKNIALSAVLVSLLCPALRAGTLEDAFAAGSAAARKAAADPCLQNKELERVGFLLKLSDTGRNEALDLTFDFTTCSVSDTGERTPSAVRSYKGGYGGWRLVLETEEGSSDTYVTLVQDDTVSGSLGHWSKVSLLKDAIRFNASVAIVRGKDRELTGPAVLLSYDPTPTPADPDGPTGCQ